MGEQLENWRGEFGRAYTDRNIIDWHVRLHAFQTMLSGLSLGRVLEVGCNRGHNLMALSHLLGEQCDIVGIEPNQHAVELARSTSSKVAALHGDIFDLPFRTGYFDLVFTAGVLIHIPLDRLHIAMQELARVSGRFLLAAEYFAEEETPILYRGQVDLLWKRNFPEHFRKCLPKLSLLRNGYWGPEDGFDQVHWWVFERKDTT